MAARQKHGPAGIYDSQFGYQNVVGDDTAIEEHGKGEKQHQLVSSHQVFSG